MFPLSTRSLPADAEALRLALNQSLNQIVQPAAADRVTIEDRSYPRLAAIRISLDGSIATTELVPPFTKNFGPVEPALEVEQFEMFGRPLRVQQAAIDLSCVAQNVEIAQGRDANGNVLLLLHKAATGNLEVSVSTSDLQSLIRSAATVMAAREGVILEEVAVNAVAPTARSLEIEVRVRARKLFLTTQLRIKGSAALDEQLNLTLVDLKCVGEGTLGTLACGVLGPHLERFNGRSFPLLALPLGEVKLRDVQIAINPNFRVSAQFGNNA
jgi:hypothetical protein